MNIEGKDADLRSFLEKLRSEQPQKLVHITSPVPLDYSSTAIAMELHRRGQDAVILLDDVGCPPFKVVANTFASHDLIAYSVGQEASSFHDYLAACLDHLIPSTRVKNPAVQEIVLTGSDIDLTKLPIPLHFEGDAGPYITAGMVAANDPDTGCGNLAYARLQVKGKHTMGISLHSRQHLWDYHRRAAEQGRDLEAAIVIGAHPSVMIAAAAKMGADQDEYEFAGSLQGRSLEVSPCKTVDVMVPARAELVIEGRIKAEKFEPEGPFGEYTGYLTGRSTNNVFEVSAITYRHDPLFVDIIPGNSPEHLILGRVVKEAWVKKRMKETLPYFLDFHYPSSGTHFHCYVRIDKHGEGYAKLAGTLLLGLDHYVKLVIVVDKDIDITDERQVMWAVATRMQADKDVSIVANVACNQLDPSSEGGVGAKMIIDATKSLSDTSSKISLSPASEMFARDILDSLQ